MSNLIRGLRTSIRSHTPDGEDKKLVFHIVTSSILGVIVVFVARFFNHSSEIVNNIGVLIGFVGTIFALLFTVLAIILTFRGQYSENRAIKELQRTGQYRSIFRRFYLSVFSVGILFILFASFAIFGIHQIEIQYQIPATSISINPIEVGTVFFIAGGFLLTALRMSTCFVIYYRIEYIMRQDESH